MRPEAEPRRRLFADLARAILDSSAELSPEERRRLAAGGRTGLVPELASYLDKVERASYTTTDREVKALARRVGEEVVFEATLAVALGAAERRVETALALLGTA